MSYHHGNLRQDLLQRAAEVIAGDGIEKLSLRALARDLGVSHSAPARHFKDKTALLSALAEESYTRVVAELDAAMEAAGSDAMARYNAIGKALVAFALERPAYFRAMFHPEVRNKMNDKQRAQPTTNMDRHKEAGRAAQAASRLPGHDPEIAVLFSQQAHRG
ncbi:MAG: TetR/AcrR family transcriptional regulator [Candidatus Phaeomarinobacter sp.]